MERIVTYKGVEVARFDWVGVREMDVASASGSVEEAFRLWPDKAPVGARLQLVVMALSTALRAPLAAAMAGPLDVTNLAPRDHFVEGLVRSYYVIDRGMRRLEKLYRREQEAKVPA